MNNLMWSGDASALAMVAVAFLVGGIVAVWLRMGRN